jgi:endo-1,4-beta-xylanase
MVDVTVNYSPTDSCGQPACQISSVTCNEPISSSDYTIVDGHHVKLSADRLGSGNGRIYMITISCTDASGNSSSQPVMVTVPHDQGKK